MRLAVRLAIEIKSGINELKEILQSEHIGFNLTNGFVVENMEARIMRQNTTQEIYLSNKSNKYFKRIAKR